MHIREQFDAKAPVRLSFYLNLENCIIAATSIGTFYCNCLHSNCTRYCIYNKYQ